MNKEQAKQAIAVMQAWVDGEQIEFKVKHLPDDAFRTPTEKWGLAWNWDDFVYRRKPKPKIVERWALSDEQGHHTTMLDLDSARTVADHWEMMGSTGICLTHLTGEEQPWQE